MAAMSFENYDASNGESSEEFGFEPGYDAFPDAGVFRETQTTLHPDYRGGHPDERRVLPNNYVQYQPGGMT